MTNLGPKGLGPLFLMERPLAAPELKAGLLPTQERIQKDGATLNLGPAMVGRGGKLNVS